ncbi:glycosyltransferase family 8 protein [Streptomyces sp. NPDC004752]
MHLLYSANRPYLFPMAVSLFSAMQNASSPISATIAVEAIDTRCQEALRSLFRDMDVRFKKLPSHQEGVKWPVAMFARLLIDKLVPKSTENALYLDSDTIVLGDVSELAGSIPQDKIVSAVQDDFANRMHGWSAYFNSGVISVHIPAWKAAGVGPAAMQLVSREEMSDQHALNTVLAGRWAPLDPRWNVMTHFYAPSVRWEYATDARQRPAIRHFTVHKPWLSERKGMGASHFHAAAAGLHELDADAWAVLKEAATEAH